MSDSEKWSDEESKMPRKRNDTGEKDFRPFAIAQGDNETTATDAAVRLESFGPVIYNDS